MSFPFADILRDINGIMFERPKDVSIQVSSLDSFVAALNKVTDLNVSDPKGVTEASFCGVDVKQNDIVPRGHGSNFAWLRDRQYHPLRLTA